MNIKSKITIAGKSTYKFNNKDIFRNLSVIKLFIIMIISIFIIEDFNLQAQNTYQTSDNHNFTTDTLYFDNGRIKNIRSYNNDMSLMYVKLFDENSRSIIAEGKYLNREKDSVWNMYSSAGFILNKIEYKQNKKNGLEYTYYPNGDVAEIKEWKDDIQNGVWKQYFIGGILKTDATYKNGDLEGKITFYHYNSKPSLGGVYEKGSREGLWMYFDEDGNVIKEENYKNGFLIDNIKNNQ